MNTLPKQMWKWRYGSFQKQGQIPWEFYLNSQPGTKFGNRKTDFRQKLQTQLAHKIMQIKSDWGDPMHYEIPNAVNAQHEYKCLSFQTWVDLT